MNGTRGNRISGLLMLVLLAGTKTAHAAESLQTVHQPGVDLPEGEGRTLLLAACTRCHDLRGLSAYKGYWSNAHWRNMIETMVKNGASLTEQQTEILAEYLAEHFGKPAPLPE